MRKTFAIILMFSMIIASMQLTKVEAAGGSPSAKQIADSINVGWNLGNSLDSCVKNGRSYQTDNTAYFETAWGNPVVTKELIDAVRNAGFNSIRIPVTWYYNTYATETTNYQVRASWMERVAQVVDYAMADGMYVILDSHHDNPMIHAQMEDVDIVAKNVSDLWSQIANRFRDYDYRLMFEGFNEINNKANNWQYSKESAVAANYLNQIFVNTVRATGGNNADRVLICGTYMCENSQTVLDSFELPADTVSGRLMVDVHSYAVEYDQSVEELFERLENFSNRVGAPVVIGEFGTTNEFSPAELRSVHAGNFVARAATHGIKCFWWDDGGKYFVFDRKTNSVKAVKIVSSLINPKSNQSSRTDFMRFSDAAEYEYLKIDSKTGELVKPTKGSMTLNVNKTGYAVTGNSNYHIKLYNVDKGAGMRICGIAFYDKNQKFISFMCPNQSQNQVCDVKTPNNAAYMRITFYNPWGYRSLQDFREFFASGLLYLEIYKY